MATSQKPRKKSHIHTPITHLVGYVVSIDPSKGIQKTGTDAKGQMCLLHKSEISKTFTQNDYLPGDLPSVPNQIVKRLDKEEIAKINARRKQAFEASIELALISATKYKEECEKQYPKNHFHITPKFVHTSVKQSLVQPSPNWLGGR